MGVAYVTEEQSAFDRAQVDAQFARFIDTFNAELDRVSAMAPGAARTGLIEQRFEPLFREFEAFLCDSLTRWPHLFRRGPGRPGHTIIGGAAQALKARQRKQVKQQHRGRPAKYNQTELDKLIHKIDRAQQLANDDGHRMSDARALFVLRLPKLKSTLSRARRRLSS